MSEVYQQSCIQYHWPELAPPGPTGPHWHHDAIFANDRICRRGLAAYQTVDLAIRSALILVSQQSHYLKSLQQGSAALGFRNKYLWIVNNKV